MSQETNNENAAREAGQLKQRQIEKRQQTLKALGVDHPTAVYLSLQDDPSAYVRQLLGSTLFFIQSGLCGTLADAERLAKIAVDEAQEAEFHYKAR